MKQNEKAKAILFIRPNAEFVLRDLEVEWMDVNQTKPTEIEIEEAWIAYQEKEAADKQDAEVKRQAALDKLAALGLEPDDLKALGL